MKTNYIFAAILVSSLIGAFIASRSMKTVFALVSGALALYALLRQVI
ncbi:hypothetical protein [Roseateles amylovorans]|uniref:Uncharacterized protein n=1 Tax=Roseateles amylovorans TaxID=2978473 RepID=A0ABY6B7L8_9BURK|nr:hypothetical protein [Roseateles amylovorans]UXH79206.1 hypothetical protein N4261_04525 [Roseateles amylovorans]